MEKELSSYVEFLNNKLNPIFEKYKNKLNLDYLETNITQIDNDVVIQVFIDYKFSIDFKLIEEFTNLVNSEIDNLVEDDVGPYILDISSSSENRLIKIDDLKYFVDKYINVKTTDNDYKDLKLLSYDDKQLFCKHNIKGRIKNIQIDVNLILEIHISYKI